MSTIWRKVVEARGQRRSRGSDELLWDWAGRRTGFGAGHPSRATATTPVALACTHYRKSHRSPATERVSSSVTSRSLPILAVRKHAGMMVPAPVQAAMVAALTDDAQQSGNSGSATHNGAPRCCRRWAPRVLRSTIGRRLYLWATRCGEPCRRQCRVAGAAHPGGTALYGLGGAQHAGGATATDERVAARSDGSPVSATDAPAAGSPPGQQLAVTESGFRGNDHTGLPCGESAGSCR